MAHGFPGQFELCPYGIWNEPKLMIHFMNGKFELCPYGIWNEVKKAEIILRERFELCPYGIWNEPFLYNGLTTVDLNFVPMGFETRQISLLVK